jgi:succinyl-CoA synthetase beta subunit
MKIHEYQARDLFAAAGIPVPPAQVATTPAEAKAIAAELGVPVVVKAQVLTGGRGKAGGVKLAANPDEAESAARDILGIDISGFKVDKVLVAVASDIAKEIYLGAIVDRQTKSVLLMASAEGGVEIEETARTNPEAIIKAPTDPATGLASHQARAVGFQLGLDWPQVRQFDNIARKLVQTVVDLDASLAEINPLIVTPEGELRAIDAKVTIDDSAVFRHSDLAELRNPEEETGPERDAREGGISYVKLSGNIGCMVNGAGLAMALLDVIQLHGGEPANFLDVGGGADADQVRTAMEIILADPAVELVLVNIFGGITRCDDVARGVVAATSQLSRSVPLVVRLVGTNEEEGLRILKEAGISAHRNMVEAVKAAVAGVSA